MGAEVIITHVCAHRDRERVIYIDIEIEIRDRDREEKEQVEYLASSMMPSISQLFGATPHSGAGPL